MIQSTIRSRQNQNPETIKSVGPTRESMVNAPRPSGSDATLRPD